MAVTLHRDTGGTRDDAWVSFDPLHALEDLRFRDHGGPVVVVAPHPDDETLALGGLLHQMAKMERDVTIIAVTDGEASHPRSATMTRAALSERRRQERWSALARLGLERVNVVRLGEPDGGVTASEALIARFAEYLHGAALCFAPWRSDGHPDHDATGEVTARAAAREGVPFVEYLVWAWHRALPETSPIPWERARRIALAPDARRAKANAIDAYKSQIAPLSDLPGDEAILDEEMLAHFRRSFEVVLV